MQTYPFITALLFLSLTTSAVSAQHYFERAAPVPVKNGTNNMAFPWAGGLNNVHFSEADLNNDGIDDLVIFERSDNILMTFLNNGTPNKVDYQYAPEYEKNFPETVHWVLMNDFNCDGIADLFTNNNQYTDIYMGQYNSDSELVFEYFDYLKYQSSSGISHIFVASVNLPAIADINNDGDLDILTFDFSSNSYIEYYENMSLELTGNCGDTAFYQLADDCWGNIYESGSARTAEILDTCGFIVPKTTGLHAGGTMLAADLNGDNVKELLMGTLSFPSMNRMLNGGSPDTAMIVEQDTFFPSYDVPVEMPFNAAPFLVDVNNDGLKDLIVSPNARNISENFRCVQYYQNTGNAVFDLVSDSFMVGDMLDFGSTSKPVFFDYNGDGLTDIVVGNQNYYVQFSPGISQLALLENTGTASSPVYTLVTRNFAGLSSLGFSDISPAFGDLDDDGDQDMIIGEEDGKIHLFENTAGIGNPASFALKTVEYENIDVGKFSTPFLYDLNEDGLLDLLIGEQNGNINYHQNTGSKTVANFDAVPTNKELGDIDVRDVGSIQGYSTPGVVIFSGSTTRYIVSGSFSGKVYLYEVNPANLTGGAFRQVTDFLTRTPHGFNAHTAVTDMNGDGALEMLIGSDRGGLVLFTESDLMIGVNELKHSGPAIEIYPNPAEQHINILFPEYETTGEIGIKIIDLKGAEVAVYEKKHAGKIMQIQFDLKPGMYLLKLAGDNQNYFRKFVVH